MDTSKTYYVMEVSFDGKKIDFARKWPDLFSAKIDAETLMRTEADNPENPIRTRIYEVRPGGSYPGDCTLVPDDAIDDRQYQDHLTYAEFMQLDDAAKLKLYNEYLKNAEYGLTAYMNSDKMARYVDLLENPPKGNVDETMENESFPANDYRRNDRYVVIGSSEFGDIISFNDFKKADEQFFAKAVFGKYKNFISFLRHKKATVR